MKNTPFTRRKLFHVAGVATTAAMVNPEELLASSSSGTEVCVFNKPLQHLNYEAQAELVAEMGFQGIEGTVRKGGHVEPGKVEEDLPRQIAALKKCGLKMTIMTTDVNDAAPEIHQRVLKTASQLGVTRFRMGAIKYTNDSPIDQQLTAIKSTFRDLVAFCKPLGIRPLYQNHAGAGRLGAGIWDLHGVLESLPADSSGVAFDIRHATVEGGQSWPTEFDLIRTHFGIVYCKDFTWPEGSNRPKNVPLGTGRVDYPAFFKRLKKSKYSGPISLHMEYKDHRDPSLLQESIAAIKADKKTLDDLLSS